MLVLLPSFGSLCSTEAAVLEPTHLSVCVVLYLMPIVTTDRCNVHLVTNVLHSFHSDDVSHKLYFLRNSLGVLICCETEAFEVGHCTVQTRYLSRMLKLCYSC